ncbi:MAG: hypothetical protein NTX45_24955 [Proteobacteria bacterium]|nr:hypothetical protein [Pseudomonadota bacterium]
MTKAKFLDGKIAEFLAFLFQISIPSNHNHRISPSAFAAAANGPDAKPISLGGGWIWEIVAEVAAVFQFSSMEESSWAICTS